MLFPAGLRQRTDSPPNTPRAALRDDLGGGQRGDELALLVRRDGKRSWPKVNSGAAACADRAQSRSEDGDGPQGPMQATDRPPQARARHAPWRKWPGEASVEGKRPASKRRLGCVEPRIGAGPYGSLRIVRGAFPGGGGAV